MTKEKSLPLINEMESFLSEVSHDIKNPIGCMTEYVELLTMGFEGEVTDKQKQFLKKISSLGFQAISFINLVFDILRLHNHVFHLFPENMDMVSALKESTSSLENDAQEKNLSLNAALPSDPIYAQGDPKRIGQIFTLCLSSFIQNTDGEDITLTMDVVEKGELEISFRSSNYDIDEDKIASLLHPFDKMPANTPSSFEKKNIRLFFCRLLIEAMHGTMRAESNEEKGLAIIISLPLQGTE